jgi:hypothetical protein
VGLLRASDFSVSLRLKTAPIFHSLLTSAPVRFFQRRRFLGTAVPASEAPIQTVRGVRRAWENARVLTRAAQLVNAEFALLPGFLRAVYSTLREGPLRGMDHAFSALGALAASGRLRVLLIWVCRRLRLPAALSTGADTESNRARRMMKYRFTMRTPYRSTFRTCA